MTTFTATQTDLAPALAKSLAFLSELRDTRMTLEDRAELIDGTLMNLASAVADTVTDWSSPRPVMPLSSWQAWLTAHDLVKGQADGFGDSSWLRACKALRDDLAYGYAAWKYDIA